MSQVQAERLQHRIGALQIAIIALAVITALIHLQRGIGMSLGGFGGGPGGPGGPPGGGEGRPPGGPPGGLNIMQLLPIPLPMLFLLNGIGYLMLVTALYLPSLAQYQSMFRWLLILFTAVTIVMYFVINGFRLNPLGIFDKLVEIALIALLLIDGRQASSSTKAAPVAT
ncbi:MAG TPA: hypothetical protein VFO07_20620 [Roseiflexaceae bacterium]|nr:hypothetical protein [Roseiflexaceae bacterium]